MICEITILFSSQFWHIVIALSLSMVFGAIIGAEREYSGKPAGLRTNMLICMGAAIFTIISQMIAEQNDADIGRIVAQIVSGVGFIGAGAIIRDRGGVHGLTTAAGIWLVAAVGVACGFGYYLIAAIATVFATLSLLVFHPISEFFRRHSNKGDEYL